jgi:hypothetical protein
MKRWGVHHVDIDILQWGSEVQSLKVLVAAGQTWLRPTDDHGSREEKREDCRADHSSYSPLT